jgi:hypothetical protein
METISYPTLPTSNIDIDQREFPDLIEVSPQTLSKIEDVGEENPNSPTIVRKCYKWMKIYVKKLNGLHEKRPKRLPRQEYFWSFIGALLGIAAVAFLHFRLLEQYENNHSNIK